MGDWGFLCYTILEMGEIFRWKGSEERLRPCGEEARPPGANPLYIFVKVGHWVS